MRSANAASHVAPKHLLESADDDGQIPSVIDVDVVRRSLAQLA